MKTTLIILAFGVCLSVASVRRDNDDYADDEDFNPGYRPVRRHYGRGYRRSRHHGYDDDEGRDYRSQRRSRSDSPRNYGFSWGGKGSYKGSASAQGDLNVLGNKAAFKRATAQEGQGEAGGKVSLSGVAVGAKGQSRGSGTGAVMADTFAGKGSSKFTGAHDMGGETGLSWDPWEDSGSSSWN